MCLENLEVLLERKIVSWPIEIEVIDKKNAFITDERIPREWLT